MALTRVGIFNDDGSGLEIEFDDTEGGSGIRVTIGDCTARVPLDMLYEMLDAAGVGMETAA